MHLASAELYYLSQFIAADMFNINIPQNILEWYDNKEKYGLSDDEKRKNPKSKLKKKTRSHSSVDPKKNVKSHKLENNYLKEIRDYGSKETDEEDLFHNNPNDIPLKNIPLAIKKVVAKHKDCKCNHDYAKIINSLKHKNQELIVENLNIRKNLILNKSTPMRAYLALDDNIDNQIRQENLSLTNTNNNNISSGQVIQYLNNLIENSGCSR